MGRLLVAKNKDPWTKKTMYLTQMEVTTPTGRPSVTGIGERRLEGVNPLLRHFNKFSFTEFCTSGRVLLTPNTHTLARMHKHKHTMTPMLRVVVHRQSP